MRKEPMHACFFAVQNLEIATKHIEIATNLFGSATKTSEIATKSLVDAISPPYMASILPICNKFATLCCLLCIVIFWMRFF